MEKIASDLQLTIETSLSDLTSANTAFSASLKYVSLANDLIMTFLTPAAGSSLRLATTAQRRWNYSLTSWTDWLPN